MAKVLLGCGQGFASGADLLAAVRHFSPRGHMDTCSSASCCWRWAAEELVEEYRELSRVSQGLRTALEKENGQSVQQQLLELDVAHEALLIKFHSMAAELAALREQHQALKGAQAKAEIERDQALETLQEVECKSSASEAESVARILQLEAQLDEELSRSRARELERRLHEEIEKVRDLEASTEEAEAGFTAVKIQRTDLEWQVQGLLTRMNQMRQRKKQQQWRQARLRRRAQVRGRG